MRTIMNSAIVGNHPDLAFTYQLLFWVIGRKLNLWNFCNVGLKVLEDYVNAHRSKIRLLFILNLFKQFNEILNQFFNSDFIFCHFDFIIIFLLLIFFDLFFISLSQLKIFDFKFFSNLCLILFQLIISLFDEFLFLFKINILQWF